MARTRYIKSNKRRKAVMKAVRGHKSARRRRYRTAKESLLHAMDYATKHRRLKKRQMRSLAVIRINAAARRNGTSYSEFMHGLRTASVEIDRRSLSEMAIYDHEAFTETVRIALEATKNTPSEKVQSM